MYMADDAEVSISLKAWGTTLVIKLEREILLALEERALYTEFDPDAVVEGESDDEGAAGSDYDSDDNSEQAQMHRFYAKMESNGISFCENILADPWA